LGSSGNFLVAKNKKRIPPAPIEKVARLVLPI